MILPTDISFLTNSEICSLLAKRIKQERLAQNLKQKEFAKRANISSSTYILFEKTGQISLERLVSIIRALGKIDVLSSFLDFDKERLETDAFAWEENRRKKPIKAVRRKKHEQV